MLNLLPVRKVLFRFLLCLMVSILQHALMPVCSGHPTARGRRCRNRHPHLSNSSFLSLSLSRPEQPAENSSAPLRSPPSVTDRNSCTYCLGSPAHRPTQTHRDLFASSCDPSSAMANDNALAHETMYDRYFHTPVGSLRNQGPVGLQRALAGSKLSR